MVSQRKELQREYEEKVRRIKAGEIPCDFCNVPLSIPVCPRCGVPVVSSVADDESGWDQVGRATPPSRFGNR
jgi:hypothetical protein